MSFYLNQLTRNDPFALIESCCEGVIRILQCHRGKPIPRFWIDHPYGEEEITLLEEELIPALEQFLGRIKEIDEILQAQQELMERCTMEAELDQARAAMASEPLAAA